MSSVLGREIVHVDLTEEELAARHTSRGIAEDYAKMLAMMDTRLKGGAQDVLNDDVVKVTGKLPKTFRVFAEENKAVWQK